MSAWHVFPTRSLVTDVSDFAACEALVAFALERFGRIDVLVNNAGKDHLGRLDDGDIADFSRVIDADLYGVVHLSRAAIATLRDVKGSIVNTSSASGLGGDWNHSFYCAAKGAVTNFTRALAMDEARTGVRVNTVNPSLTYTPFTAGMQNQPALVAKFEERIPMGRGAQPGGSRRGDRLLGKRGSGIRHRRQSAGRRRTDGVERSAAVELSITQKS